MKTIDSVVDHRSGSGYVKAAPKPHDIVKLLPIPPSKRIDERYRKAWPLLVFTDDGLWGHGRLEGTTLHLE